MKSARLEHMVKGWFVGGFAPVAHHSDGCEVALKHYRAGEREGLHHHKVATEITLVVSGRVRMAGREWSAGDIVVLAPGEATDFEALTDAVNVVVKTPGALDDKYLGAAD
jgi:mannose-6-phosphate isomerase-like protein (cupin superfamily)